MFGGSTERVREITSKLRPKRSATLARLRYSARPKPGRIAAETLNR
jgi:hypothetical protein